MTDQTTDHLSEAVEAMAKSEWESARRVVGAKGTPRWTALRHDAPNKERAREKVRRHLEAAEPFFATYYEDKGRKAAEGEFVAERNDLRSTVRLLEQRVAAAEDKGRSEERERLNTTFNRWASQKYADSVPLHGCEKDKVRATAAAFRNAADYCLASLDSDQEGS